MLLSGLISFLTVFNLTIWSRVLPEKLTVPQLVKFPTFYGTRCSLPCLQEPATCPSPYSDQFTSPPTDLKIHFNIMLQSKRFWTYKFSYQIVTLTITEECNAVTYDEEWVCSYLRCEPISTITRTFWCPQPRKSPELKGTLLQILLLV